MDWVVKATRSCNLRCRYCYEWDHLSDPARLPLAAWQRLLCLIRDAHLEHTASNPNPVKAPRIVWHGGEPLALPWHYFVEVIWQQRAVLEAAEVPYRNLVQTNLFAPRRGLLEYLIEAGFEFGVSFDFVGGARLTASGRETGQRVLENVELLRTLGAEVGFIVVVAGHNLDHLDRIYDTARREARRLRLLPLFAGPPTRPMQGLEVVPEAMSAALLRLFRRWVDDGCVVDIEPFTDYLTTVLMHRLGLDRAPCLEADSGPGGFSVMTVDPQGFVFRGVDASDTGTAVGHLERDSWFSLRNGEYYQAALAAAVERADLACAGCSFRGACDGYPLQAVPISPDTRSGCGLHQRMLAGVDAWLAGQNVAPARLRLMLEESLRVQI